MVLIWSSLSLLHLALMRNLKSVFWISWTSISATSFRRNYEAECGPPTPDTTAIEVQLHPDSDPRIVELLERCRPWALENRATLRTTMRCDDQTGIS